MAGPLFTQQLTQLAHCLEKREPLLDAEHQAALRLLNGYYEGFPDIQVDLFGKTLVIYNNARRPDDFSDLSYSLQAFYLNKLTWITAVLVKSRYAADEIDRQGQLTFGTELDDEITEHGLRYALDLRINQDASFYLDTRNLRKWLLENAADKTVLNTFAYTGSLGLAAKMGAAKRVVQTDVNQRFLWLAKQSFRLNQLAVSPAGFLSGDFFKIVQRFRNANTLFDFVILDPPFFSQTGAGRVDLVHEFTRLVNKVRPIIGHEGRLIAINNALFASGKEVLQQVNKLCETGYVQLEQLIPVPADVTGYPETIIDHPPVDPAPFNHPTKIMILKILRKDQRTA